MNFVLDFVLFFYLYRNLVILAILLLDPLYFIQDLDIFYHKALVILCDISLHHQQLLQTLY